MKDKIFRMITVLGLLFLLYSCGNEAPVISSIKYQILIYENGSLNIGKNSIFLSVYFVLDDPNGLDDIVDVKITNSESDYSWIIPKDTLLKSSPVWDEKKYVGFSFLDYNNADSILTGDYIIEATDSVGNIADGTFFVEIAGLSSNEPYKAPQIKYHIGKVKSNEFKIIGDKYSSLEMKLLNYPKAYNGGRKKFLSGKNIIIEKEMVQPRNQISIRINQNEDENIIYFLKNFILE